MAERVTHKGQFDIVTASSKLGVMIEQELDARDSHKPGSILPELLETIRQFIVAHADDFDSFESVKPFVKTDPRLKFDK